MDFALRSLPEAFKDAAYRKSRSSYKLFAFLLATRADRHLIPELLVHFSELHYATGDDALLIAPSIQMRIGREGRPATPKEAIEVFETGIFPAYMGSVIEPVKVSGRVANFLESLTEQTYELAGFLGIGKSQIPCMLFFERLTLPAEFVRWDLRRTEPHEIIIRLRSMLDELSRRCDWRGEIPRTIARLEYELPRTEERVAAIGDRRAAGLRSEIHQREKTLEYLLSVRRLRDACVTASIAQRPDLPVDRLRGNVEHLCAEPDNERFVKYVRRQRRNWKRRLPPDTLALMDQFLAMAVMIPRSWRAARFPTIEDHVTSAERAVSAARSQLEHHLQSLADAPARARQSLVDELAQLRARANEIESPSGVLRSLGLDTWSDSPRQVGQRVPGSVSELFEYPSCFVSYSSHDADFAERLHADLERAGVKCWFAPHDLKIGEKFRQEIEDSIRVHDKLLLLLSAESIKSGWVEAEVEAAFERERREDRVLLVPITLDDEIMNTPLAWAAHVRRTRHIGDFRPTARGSNYERVLAELLRDLRAGNEHRAAERMA